ncbi:MAG TPA: ribbon-helix-helix protein, CopG family [Nitrososphaeraceae archaeon]|nr:ribbon-helix-helix protein, CopG family [Nitrososphaeraceae archaeon]
MLKFILVLLGILIPFFVQFSSTLAQEAKTSISVNIDLELWKKVKEAAIVENITLTEFLEEAIRDRLAKGQD